MTPPYGAPRHALHDHPICRASSFLRAPQRQWRTKGRTRQLMPSGLLASASNVRQAPKLASPAIGGARLLGQFSMSVQRRVFADPVIAVIYARQRAILRS